MNHFIILYICTVLAVSVQCKDLYKLILSRAEIARSVKEYGEGRVWMTKPHRYTYALNGEVTLRKIPLDTKVKIKMYEFLSNEYRPFAINFERNLCNFMEVEYRMVFYPDFLKIGADMPEPGCPLKPFFRSCNFWRRPNWTQRSSSIYLDVFNSHGSILMFAQGNYSFANFIPDIGNYPARLPFHNFMLEIAYWHGTQEMLTTRFYGTLDRDAVIREQYG